MDAEIAHAILRSTEGAGESAAARLISNLRRFDDDVGHGLSGGVSSDSCSHTLRGIVVDGIE